MRTIIKTAGIACLLLALPDLMIGQSAIESNFQAIKKEVIRTKESIELNGKKPFLISTSLNVNSYFTIKAEMGHLVSVDGQGTPDNLGASFSLLIGDESRLHTSNPQLVTRRSMIPYSTLGDPIAGQRLAWYLMDQQFKFSSMEFERRLGDISQNNYPKDELDVPEILAIKPLVMQGSMPTPRTFDVEKWKDISCRLSKIFLKYPSLERTSLTMSGNEMVNRVFTTEGADYWFTDARYSMALLASVKDVNGSYISDNRLLVFKTLDVSTAFEQLAPQVEAYAERLAKLPSLPRIDELYTGPVFFEDQAVVDLIYYQVMPMLNSQRYPLGKMSGQNDERIGKVVFSPLLTVKDLAGTQNYKGKVLPGYYPYDDNGVVPPAELTLVEDGRLMNLVSGRVPMKNYRENNGHYRNGNNVIGNLFVSVKDAKSYKALRKEYVNQVKKMGEPYAYVVSRVIFKDIFQITRIDVKTGEEVLMRDGVLDAPPSAFRQISGASKEIYEQTDEIGCWIHYNVPKAIVLDNVKIDRKQMATPEKEPIVSRPLIGSTN